MPYLPNCQRKIQPSLDTILDASAVEAMQITLALILALSLLGPGADVFFAAQGKRRSLRPRLSNGDGGMEGGANRPAKVWLAKVWLGDQRCGYATDRVEESDGAVDPYRATTSLGIKGAPAAI